MRPREPDDPLNAVWIVQHDDSPHNTVVGVLRTESEASTFAEEAKGDFENGLIYSRFEIGYRYNDTPGHRTYGPHR